MRRILGVFMALFMFCVPIGIQAEEEVLSFEYTGQKIEIDYATGYYSTSDFELLEDAPINCGKYLATTNEDMLFLKSIQKKCLLT